MAYASAPVILDSTGQNIATSLATLAANIASMKGEAGDAGLGVVSFVWYSNSGSAAQGTAGTTDIYRMTFTDNTYVDISVYNGINGIGALVWGGITGTLSNQLDLQAALNAKSDRSESVSVTIEVSDWVTNTATIAVTGVTPTSNIIITPDPDDFIAYSNAQIRATAQGNGTVTFKCETTPSEAITVNVLSVWYPKYTTVSGSIVQFYTIEQTPLANFTIDIETTQSGSGDPTPSNIRPISGFPGVNIYQESTYDGGASPTYTISWQNEAGIVSSGSLNVETGVLTVEGVLEVFNVVGGNGNIYSNINLDTLGSSGSVADLGDVVRINFARINSSLYDSISSGYAYKMCNMAKHYFNYNDTSVHWYRNTSLYVYLPKALVGSTVTSVRDYLISIKDTTPLTLWIPLATPQTVQLTPQQMNSLVGANAIWADAGDVSFTYRIN